MRLHHVQDEGRAVEGVALVGEEVAADGGAVHSLLAVACWRGAYGVRHDLRHDRAKELVRAVLPQPLLRHLQLLRHGAALSVVVVARSARLISSSTFSAQLKRSGQ